MAECNGLDRDRNVDVKIIHESNAVLTVRIIRSFEHRNIRPVVFKDINLDVETGSSFLGHVLHEIETSRRLRAQLTPPVRDYGRYDTLKVNHKAHGAKSNNPVINIDDDDRLLIKMDSTTSEDVDSTRTLRQQGVEHETELSLFNMDDYRRYKLTLSN